MFRRPKKLQDDREGVKKSSPPSDFHKYSQYQTYYPFERSYFRDASYQENKDPNHIHLMLWSLGIFPVHRQGGSEPAIDEVEQRFVVKFFSIKKWRNKKITVGP
jgi:hypothetical protein